MNRRDDRSFLNRAFRIGTPECAVFSAAVAMVLGLLFLWIGFWKTLFIFCLMLLGLFIGGVEDKQEWFRNLVNRLFPPRADVPYREPRHSAGKSSRKPVRENEGAQRPEEYQDDQEEQE
ncbi:MAG: DUF2273 domain-containing protein [Clostridia bacterium]|nr:DUF2273 domain-containing protein [Clostridia bacterium]